MQTMEKTGILTHPPIEKFPDESLYGLLKSELESSLYLFVQWAFPLVNPGKILVLNWHIEEICDIIQSEIFRIKEKKTKKKDIIINVPPRSLKSFICNVAAPAWSWTQMPEIKWVSSSYGKSLSIKHNVDCRKIIQHPMYMQIWPELELASDQNQKSEFENVFGGGKKATSVEAAITGGGGHIVLVDDPINPFDARSDTKREAAHEHVDNVLPSRLDEPEIGLFLYIMQRVHEDDTTGHLLKKNPLKYRHICIPAKLDNNVKPESFKDNYVNGFFFRTRFNDFVLEDIRSKMTALEYEGQYQQNPTPKEGNIIKKAWFNYISRLDFNELIDKNKYSQRVFIVDTAFTDKKEDNAPSGVIGGVLINNNLYIFKARKVWYEFPRLLRFLPDFAKENGYDYKSIMRIEPKANGISVVQAIKDETDLNIVTLPNSSDSKETRLNAASLKIEAGRVWLVEDDWNDEFVEDVCGFPARKDKEYVDCISYIIDLIFNDDSKSLFPVELIIGAIHGMDKITLCNNIKNSPLWNEIDYVVTSVFYSENKSTENNIITFGIDEKKCFYLLNYYSEITDNYAILINNVVRVNQNFHPNLIVVENSNLDRIYSNFSTGDNEIRVKSEKESSWKVKFEESFEHMAVMFRQNKFKFPYASAGDQEIIHNIMRQFNSLNNKESKEKSLINEKGICKSFWLAIKGLYLTGAKLNF